MIRYEDFKKNSNNLVKYVKSLYQENESVLPFPACSCGATVSDFQPLDMYQQTKEEAAKAAAEEELAN